MIDTAHGRTTHSLRHALEGGVGLYAGWVLLTWTLEGRIELLLRPTLGGRWLYVFVANILVGTVGALMVARSALASGHTTREQVGFRDWRRTAIACGLALAGGFFLFALQQPPTLAPLVVLNAFAQVLPVSIAEVLVCWAALGAAVESAVGKRRRAVAVVVAVIVADLAFAAYHVGHSPPFNEPGVMALLLIPGLLTSLVFFLGRDVYAAILIQTFLGMSGVVRNVPPDLLRMPLYGFWAIALFAVLVLVGSDALFVRHADPGDEEP